MERYKKLLLNLVIFIFSIIISFLVAEFILRLVLISPYEELKLHNGRFNESTILTADFEDTPGNQKHIEVSFQKNGFRIWGDTHTLKKRILIVGDSFTEMVYADKGNEWFSFLQNNFTNYEFFIYGQGGYSTYQEYLIVKDFYDEIKPDIILIQFCDNDYFSNDFELEKSQYPAIIPNREYLINGETITKTAYFMGDVREKSMLFDYLLFYFDKLFIKLQKYPLFKKDIISTYNSLNKLDLSNTVEILNLFSNFNNSSTYLFSTNNLDSKYLCNSTYVSCIPDVYDRLDYYEQQGNHVYVIGDGHWNEFGNQVVGEYLVEYFHNNSILS